MADQQLGLDLDEQPPKASARPPHSYHVRAHQTVAEAEAGESRAVRQDARVLAIFQARPAKRLTPSQVLDLLVAEGRPAPLLTSVRRSITNLTARGLLRAFHADRRPGPYGRPQGTWGLAE